jgi:hypothetical protein
MRMEPTRLETIAPLSGAPSNLAPANKPQVETYQIDDFARCDEPGVTTHGELVEYELGRTFQDSGGLKSTRVNLPLEFNVAEIEKGQPGSLQSFFRSHFVDRLQADAKAWNQVLTVTKGPTVVQQSQGASESRAVEHLFFRARKDADFRVQLETQLGIPLTGTEKFDLAKQARLLEALSQVSSQVHCQDPMIQASLEQLQQVRGEADRRGIIHVISAGNSGMLYQEMLRNSIPIPSGFFVNEMAGANSIIVGASDDGSKEPASDNAHKVAKLASPFANAMFGADGIDRPLFVDGKATSNGGSSFAAPQVSAKVISMLEAEPTLTREHVVEILKSQARPVDDGERFIGFGVV